MTRKFIVPEGAAAERLDVYLATKLGEARSRVLRLLKAGSVRINGHTARPSHQVQPGDALEVSETAPAATPQSPPNLPIVYEDDDILVIDKPAGLVVHAGPGIPPGATVVDFARAHTTDPDPERPGIVHRLDRDTSGLLIVAKHAESKAFMQKQFAARTIEKSYTVLAVGRLEPEEAEIRLPLDRDPAHPLRRTVTSTGREAVTRYRKLADFAGYSLAEATPHTGRTHQIRVHLAKLGHPVAGDTTYGPPKRPLGLKRHFLHATRLAFTTPAGKRVQLESPLPADLAAVLQHLSKQV